MLHLLIQTAAAALGVSRLQGWYSSSEQQKKLLWWLLSFLSIDDKNNHAPRWQNETFESMLWALGCCAQTLNLSVVLNINYKIQTRFPKISVSFQDSGSGSLCGICCLLCCSVGVWRVCWLFCFIWQGYLISAGWGFWTVGLKVW